MDFRLTGLATAALGGVALFPAGAGAQTLDLSIEIPRLKVAEYHRPYVAIWLEKQGTAPRTIAVWYDFDLKGSEGAGTKWLRDMRQWWRTVGRTMSFPADGVTGATRAPGAHKVRFTGGKGPMPVLAGGNYTLVLEAAREVGGREVLRLPFAWNGRNATASAKGSGELGAVTLNVKR